MQIKWYSFVTNFSSKSLLKLNHFLSKINLINFMTKTFVAALCLASSFAIKTVSESELWTVAEQTDCNCGSECNASADLNLVLGAGEPFLSDFCLSTAQYFACCTNPCGVECDCNGFGT